MRYLQCADIHYNESTGECSAPVWEESPSVMPELTVAQGAELGYAIAGLLLVAFFLRLLRKWSDQQ